ncbi:MAG: hypothetical protein QXU99_06725 [Candidatus Bathyarchaeia archaeon]
MFLKKLKEKFTAPNANLQLNLGQYSVALGENLTGKIIVNSMEDFDATEVRYEISCVERAKAIRMEYDAQLRRMVPRETEVSSVLFSAKPALSGPTHFANGETREFPFTINIPAGGRPTAQGIDRSVTWTLKSVVAIDGRPDIVKIADIQVVQPAAQPIIKEKEVVRQVVMIPCKYCGMLMDQLVTECPNCGAKRTG